MVVDRPGKALSGVIKGLSPPPINPKILAIMVRCVVVEEYDGGEKLEDDVAIRAAAATGVEEERERKARTTTVVEHEAASANIRSARATFIVPIFLLLSGKKKFVRELTKSRSTSTIVVKWKCCQLLCIIVDETKKSKKKDVP